MSATPDLTGPGARALPDLRFAVRDARPEAHAAVPTLVFVLAVESVGDVDVRSILLDVQIRIAARRRRYAPSEQERLLELFGPTANWGTALRTLLWTRATAIVPPFRGETTVELPVTCTYDLEVTGGRYFAALEDGEVPLELMLSGSIFYAGDDGRLQTVRLSWEHEAGYRLPVGVWRAAMDRHFAGSAWLRLGREPFDRLVAYKARHAYASWDDAIDALLEGRP